MGVDGVDSHQSENGKRPHDKNAGIVFYASYLHSYICVQEESNKQQFVDYTDNHWNKKKKVLGDLVKKELLSCE